MLYKVLESEVRIVEFVIKKINNSYNKIILLENIPNNSNFYKMLLAIVN